MCADCHEEAGTLGLGGVLQRLVERAAQGQTGRVGAALGVADGSLRKPQRGGELLLGQAQPHLTEPADRRRSPLHRRRVTQGRPATGLPLARNLIATSKWVCFEIRTTDACSVTIRIPGRRTDVHQPDPLRVSPATDQLVGLSVQQLFGSASEHIRCAASELWPDERPSDWPSMCRA